MLETIVNAEDEIALLFSKDWYGSSGILYTVPFGTSSGENQGFMARLADNSFRMHDAGHFGSKAIFCYKYQNGTSMPFMSAFVSIDMETGDYWAKTIDSVGGVCQIDMLSNGDILFLVDKDSHNFCAYRLDANGNVLSQSGFRLEDSFPDEFSQSVATDLAIGPNGDAYLLGYSTSNGVGSTKAFVSKMPTSGNVPIAKVIDGRFYQSMLFTDIGPLLINYDGVSSFPLSFNNILSAFGQNATLVQLDPDLNLVWAKEYYGENFSYKSAGIAKSPSGGLLMGHSTFGAYPAVLTELDGEGNILSQKGYPNYGPQMDILSDGSLLMSSQYSFGAGGSTTLRPVIAKTDPAGNIAGCSTLPTCLQSRDIEVQLSPLGIENYEATDTLEDIELEVAPVSFSFSEGCDFPPVPSPEFTFPDTLCRGDSATVANTNNRLANAHRWHLTGPGVDSVETDSFDFGFRFHAPGEYILEQAVWVLGCAYTFEKNITVLPGLEINITPEYICPEGPYEIGVSSGRNIETYLWNTGSTAASLPVAAPGLYSVQAGDGYCSARDSLEIKFLSDIIGSGSPIVLPEDTVVCEVHLPYVLDIGSAYSDVFFINSDTIYDGQYVLNDSGTYAVGTDIHGCWFSKKYGLETSACEAAIYLPNVFSPNGDGANDRFFPQGRDFEIVSLKIFDRWGGLQYDGRGAGAAWSPGGGAVQGLYLYRLVYRNLLTGLEGQLAGEVVVVR